MALLGMGIFYGGVITGVPVVTGVAEGVHHQKQMNAEAADETYMVKFYLDLGCPAAPSLKDHTIVLAKDKVWAVPKDPSTEQPAPIQSQAGTWVPHPFTGFYIMYPDEDRDPPERGLVSTISVDPPMLNWIYADSQTQELRYGNRTGSIAHIVGPWDWTQPGEEAVTLDGWEGFVVVDEGVREDGLRWAIYYDRWDDDFGGNGRKIGGRKHYECSMERRLLPEELRKAQEDEADRKMQVKTSGDMTTKFEAPGTAK